MLDISSASNRPGSQVTRRRHHRFQVGSQRPFSLLNGVKAKNVKETLDQTLLVDNASFLFDVPFQVFIYLYPVVYMHWLVRHRLGNRLACYLPMHKFLSPENTAI